MTHRHGADGGEEFLPPTSQTEFQAGQQVPVLTGALLAGPFPPVASHHGEKKALTGTPG